MRDDTSYVDFVTGRWPALFRLSFLLTGGSEHAGEDPTHLLVAVYDAAERWRRFACEVAADLTVDDRSVGGRVLPQR